MAKYSVELNDIVKSGLKIFDFEYDFYNPELKPDFEEKFINHFRFREIGAETVGRFQHNLKVKCDEVLPYYNMLLETSLYDYDIKNNYNLTETFTKTNNKTNALTGSTITDGTTDNEKTSNLDSTADHTQNVDFTKNENVNETGTTDGLTTNELKNKIVDSDTPTALLSMTDIENNVYATKANIADGTNTNTDKQTNVANRIGTQTETTGQTANDTVEATNRETATGTMSNKSDTIQNATETNDETYTLERVGDIGVDTTPDKIKKHIEIQKILKTVYVQFFNECDDLFMQIF